MFVPSRKETSIQRERFRLYVYPPNHGYHDVLVMQVSGLYGDTREDIEVQAVIFMGCMVSFYHGYVIVIYAISPHIH